MNGMTSGWAFGGFNANNGITSTWEWDFAPAFTVAQVSLHGVVGGGLMFTGVISYKYRPNPNEPDVAVPVGDPNNLNTWGPFLYADQCTGVTFGSAQGAGQEFWILGNLFFW